MQSPFIARALRLDFAGSNMIHGFSVSLDGWDEMYPYLHIGRSFALEKKRFEEFLSERQRRFSNTASGEPVSPANRSQPIRSE